MQVRALSSKISIGKKTQLAGFVGDIRYAATDESDLELSIIQLRQNASGCIVTLCALDTLSVGEEIINYVENLLSGPCIFLASHTHSAPNLDKKLESLGCFDSDYFDEVCEKLSEIIKRLSVRKFIDAKITLSTGNTQNVKRRRIDFSILNWGFSVRCSREKPENYPIFVVNIKSVNGKSCLGRLWSIPCHPVCTPDYNKNGSDFIGIIRKYFQQYDNHSSINLFAQGLSGDLRPPAYTKSFNFKTITNKIISRFGFKLFTNFTNEEYQSWVRMLFDELQLCIKNEILDVDDDIIYDETVLPLESVVLEKSSEHLQIKGLRLGDICFIFLQGEPVSDWYSELPKNIAGLRMIYAGYSGPVFGYLPTSKLIPHGGYEVREFAPFFGFKGTYTDKLTSEVQSKIYDLACKLAAG